MPQALHMISPLSLSLRQSGVVVVWQLAQLWRSPLAFSAGARPPLPREDPPALPSFFWRLALALAQSSEWMAIRFCAASAIAWSWISCSFLSSCAMRSTLRCDVRTAAAATASESESEDEAMPTPRMTTPGGPVLRFVPLVRRDSHVGTGEKGRAGESTCDLVRSDASESSSSSSSALSAPSLLPPACCCRRREIALTLFATSSSFTSLMSLWLWLSLCCELLGAPAAAMVVVAAALCSSISCFTRSAASPWLSFWSSWAFLKAASGTWRGLPWFLR
mmetsp:Transcript_1416/g.3633  ORF Transcript_1416/g.3633 Transcript_1416/m.3633 type:complete len:277 (-) Transcript_1416:973-1803(-)